MNRYTSALLTYTAAAVVAVATMPTMAASVLADIAGRI